MSIAPTTPPRWAWARERLAAQDARVDAVAGPRRSLCPGRRRATSLLALGEGLLAPTLDAARVEAFVEGVCAVAQAQLEHFPETLFWDMDLLAASALRRSAPRAPAEITRVCAAVVALQAQFGRHSIICFRYVHDFMYGYDWARWVRKDVEARAGVGPFDLTFLRYLAHRGGELVELIANDDDKYPKLPDGTPRNPFGFSREPEDELVLYRELAARGLIPVEAWDVCGVGRWDRAFREVRAEVARELGMEG